MAEAAGLVFGAIVLVKPLCETIHSTWTTHQNVGKDAARLRLRFSVQHARLTAFERVLFEPDKFLRGRLIDHLPPQTGDDLLELLRQLYTLLVAYATLKKQFIQDPLPNPTAFTSGSEPPSSAALIAHGTRSDAAAQKNLSWSRKLVWTFSSKRTTEKLVRDFEEWTERMKTLLEIAWWGPLQLDPMSILAKAQRMEKDEDARDAGLLRGIGLRKILADPGGNTGTAPKLTSFKTPVGMEISRLRFKMQLKLPGGGNYELGTLSEDDSSQNPSTPSSTPYLVEYKSYDSPSPSTAITRRIWLLAALLHEAPTSDRRFRVCQCVHYFHDVPGRRYGLVYALPSGKSKESSATELVTPSISQTPDTTTSTGKTLIQSPPSSLDCIPITLGTLLISPSFPRPSLTARLRLAHALAQSVLLLHSYGWVHKSLWSEGILFFPSAAPGEIPTMPALSPPTALSSLPLSRSPPAPVSHPVSHLTAPATQNPKLPSPVSQIPSNIPLHLPYLAAFEYARHESHFSSYHVGTDAQRNLYRHPARWGAPSERFAKTHDIYALGVLLLTLGLWERADHIDKGALLALAQDTKNQQPGAVKDRLLKHARKRLGFYAGEKYKRATLFCLEVGGAGMDEWGGEGGGAGVRGGAGHEGEDEVREGDERGDDEEEEDGEFQEKTPIDSLKDVVDLLERAWKGL